MNLPPGVLVQHQSSDQHYHCFVLYGEQGASHLGTLRLINPILVGIPDSLAGRGGDVQK